MIKPAQDSFDYFIEKIASAVSFLQVDNLDKDQLIIDAHRKVAELALSSDQFETLFKTKNSWNKEAVSGNSLKDSNSENTNLKVSSQKLKQLIEKATSSIAILATCNNQAEAKSPSSTENLEEVFIETLAKWIKTHGSIPIISQHSLFLDAVQESNRYLNQYLRELMTQNFSQFLSQIKKNYEEMDISKELFEKDEQLVAATIRHWLEHIPSVETSCFSTLDDQLAKLHMLSEQNEDNELRYYAQSLLPIFNTNKILKKTISSNYPSVTFLAGCVANEAIKILSHTNRPLNFFWCGRLDDLSFRSLSEGLEPS